VDAVANGVGELDRDVGEPRCVQPGAVLHGVDAVEITVEIA
jgi:hypothetical protein